MGVWVTHPGNQSVRCTYRMMWETDNGGANAAAMVVSEAAASSRLLVLRILIRVCVGMSVAGVRGGAGGGVVCVGCVTLAESKSDQSSSSLIAQSGLDMHHAWWNKMEWNLRTSS